MADINKDVGAGHGAPDYATLTLWNAGEGAADPGATFLSIANCSGDCGTIANISGTFIRGADIRGDVTYNLKNESSLAFTTRLFTTADNINIFDMKITESNNFQDVYKPLGANSFATRCRIIHSGTPTTNNGEINLTSTAANKGLKFCAISTGGAQLIRHGFDRPATITNTIGFGATTRGMMFSGANQDYEDCYFYDCNSAAYVGSTGLVHCASDDLTATVGFQSIASTALVATGSDDYQSASGGALDVTPFIGAFLEVSGGVTVTGATPNYSYIGISGTVDLTGEVLVTGQTPNYSYSPINGLIDLTGSINITGQTANYTYNSIDGNVDLTGVISIVGVTASYSYQSISGNVDLTGEISVLGVTPNYNYNSINGLVELGALISVIGQTANYNYNGVNGVIELAGEINISGSTPSYSYTAISGFVTIGEGQVIGTVTAGFADDLYSAGFKPSVITVSFKS